MKLFLELSAFGYVFDRTYHSRRFSAGSPGNDLAAASHPCVFAALFAKAKFKIERSVLTFDLLVAPRLHIGTVVGMKQLSPGVIPCRPLIGLVSEKRVEAGAEICGSGRRPPVP